MFECVTVGYKTMTDAMTTNSTLRVGVYAFRFAIKISLRELLANRQLHNCGSEGALDNAVGKTAIPLEANPRAKEPNIIHTVD